MPELYAIYYAMLDPTIPPRKRLWALGSSSTLGGGAGAGLGGQAAIVGAIPGGIAGGLTGGLLGIYVTLVEPRHLKMAQEHMAQVAKTGRARSNSSYIKGGRAEGKSWTNFDPHQLIVGTFIEAEHTPDWRIAREIAMDHLAEFDDYYDPWLLEMEKAADAAHAKTNGRIGDAARWYGKQYKSYPSRVKKFFSGKGLDVVSKENPGLKLSWYPDVLQQFQARAEVGIYTITRHLNVELMTESGDTYLIAESLGNLTLAKDAAEQHYTNEMALRIGNWGSSSPTDALANAPMGMDRSPAKWIVTWPCRYGERFMGVGSRGEAVALAAAYGGDAFAGPLYADGKALRVGQEIIDQFGDLADPLDLSGKGYDSYLNSDF